MLETRFDPEEIEARIYGKWERSGYFNPDRCVEDGHATPDAPVFSIVLPPPNVTGTLHMGHAFEDTIQDIIVRYKRMSGLRTLWIPGTDHAAIATQSKVEKIIQKEEGKSRYDLGREDFLRRVSAFAQESHDTIVSQVKAMGASLDWTREAYTLDEKRSLAVRTAFSTMHALGLIYRGNRVVNWDPKGQTVISDDEIVYEERKGVLYTFTYSPDFPIPISTTRPETKVGDTAVAVHPDDPRYRQYIGQTFEIADFCGEALTIRVIADEHVEKEFGTGALGVTPAHAQIDFEMAMRHNLPVKTVIDERARMTAGAVQGKKTSEAREEVVAWLRKAGLLQKEEEVIQNIATAERTGGVIEPLPKLQWFIAVDKPFTMPYSQIDGIASGQEITLKQLMRHVVETGQIAITPERFSKIYMHWIENLHDWCISRQLWFGHRIPVWYRGEEFYCGVTPPEGEGWEQDPDTLDTWFSSGLWTFSTLGWPDNTEDLATYHPTSFINPGYEILFFWVARMILMSTCLLGQVPFRQASLHGIVRDGQGRKFSKSLGNGIDPLDMAKKYGADAVRMALVVGSAPGNDVKFDENRVRGYRNFSTKLWNIARFADMHREAAGAAVFDRFTPEQEQDFQRIAELHKEVTESLDRFEYHIASEKLYHYVWHELADVIVEREKEALKGGDGEAKARSYAFLERVLLDCLVMLHPFMPFITEAIYRHFRPEAILMVTPWDPAQRSA